ncbi:MAG TPA: response regulator [Gemmatimonadales bacterium]|nr:response regulator [Gemmatimonadales bacterium]
MARIIVIDDDAVLRATVVRALETVGHEVRAAEEGEHGLALLAEQPADLLITDIFMPGQDGIVTLVRIRKEFPGLKVIVMSGGGMDGRLDFLEDARVLGALATLRKPFGPADVRRVVKEVLEGAP